jgi:hypothetical protein
MIDPQPAALSPPSAVASERDDYLLEAIALAKRINQRLAERALSQAQGLVADDLMPPPAVGPAA